MKKQTIHWEDDICQILKNTCHRISIQNIYRTLKTQRLRNKQRNVKSTRDMKRYSAKEYVQVAWKHTETYSTALGFRNMKIKNRCDITLHLSE